MGVSQWYFLNSNEWSWRLKMDGLYAQSGRSWHHKVPKWCENGQFWGLMAFLEMSIVTWISCQVNVDGNSKVECLRSNQTVICVKGEGNIIPSLPSQVKTLIWPKVGGPKLLVEVDGPWKLVRLRTCLKLNFEFNSLVGFDWNDHLWQGILFCVGLLLPAYDGAWRLTGSRLSITQRYWTW